MANEPERPIEELLRAAAKKRGEEAGGAFDLHPATRRVLQGEVARKFGRETPKVDPAPGLSLRLWPRLAWGGGILAVLVLVIWIVVPKSTERFNENTIALKQPVPEGSAESRSANMPRHNAIAPDQFVPERSSASRSAVPAPAPTPTPVPDVAPTPPPAPATASPPPEGNAEHMKSEATAADKALDAPRNENAPAPPVTAPAPAIIAPTPAPETPKVAMEEKNPPPLGFGGLNLQDADKSKTAPADRKIAKDTTTLSGAAPTKPDALVTDSPGLPAAASPPPAPAPAPAMPAEVATVAKPQATGPGTAKPASSAFYALKSEPATREAYAVPNSSMPAKEAERPPVVMTNAVSDIALAPAPAQKLAREGMVTDAIAANGALATRASSPSVLASFRVEQQGSDLRIIDTDGSVYSGYVQPATSANRRRAATAATPASANASAPPLSGASAVGQDYAFEVKGTNLTSHKKVVFKGYLTTMTNLVLFKTPANTSFDFQTGASSAAQPQTPPKSSITGKLSVGGGKETEINATPAPP